MATVTRKRFDRLSTTERNRFVTAVKRMKSHDLHIGASGTSSSTGGTYQKYVNWHNNDAEHLTVSFLPWHRVMLWELEEDLIKADEQLVFNCVS